MSELLKNIEPLGKRTRFSFHCKSCGACCKNVRDSIMLNAHDAFRLVSHFKKQYPQKSSEEILDMIADVKILVRGFCVYVLKTDGGVCEFLKDNKCSVYTARPHTCRIYPLSLEATDDCKSLKWYLCTEQAHHFSGNSTTAREWERKCLSEEEKRFVLAETRAMKEIGEIIFDVPDSKLNECEAATLAFNYYAYDTSVPFLVQYEENMQILKEYLNRLTETTEVPNG